jgi:predicted  nucleic acid-binding Zn-ribbon protein
MTDKTRTTVYLTDANVEWMDSQSINRSELINKLVRRYREGGGQMDAVLADFEKERIRSQMEQAKARLETLEGQLERVDDVVTSPEERREEQLHETFADMTGIPADPDNPAVRNQADNHDMDAETFADRLATWRADDA